MKEAPQTIWLRLDRRLVRQLDRIAKAEKRSRASMLSILVAESIERRDTAAETFFKHGLNPS